MNANTKERKMVHGVGTNDASYSVYFKMKGKAKICPYYSRWSGMLRRCYSKNKSKYYPTYKDCTVSEDWLLFSNFKMWMVKQDWQGKQLDKDLLSPGNKVYGEEYCLFVSGHMNTLLNDCAAIRGGSPIGVHLDVGGKYKAYCYEKGRRVHLGYYKTSEGASKAYKTYKSAYIRAIADGQESIVKKALYRHADLINPISYQ